MNGSDTSSSTGLPSPAATPTTTTPTGPRGVSSYKQLAAELDATQRKLKSVLVASERTKKTAEALLNDSIQTLKAQHAAEMTRREEEWKRKLSERETEIRREEQARAEATTKELELAITQRSNDVVARTAQLYDQRLTDLRHDLISAQRTHDDLQEQHRALQEWQKQHLNVEHSLQEQLKNMEMEIERRKKAEENVARYRVILRYIVVHKFVKDVKLKKRLLPLHTSISRLIALILSDPDLKTRLLTQQAELARWVADCHAIEKAEGIPSELPHVAHTTGTTSAAAGSISSNPLIPNATNVEHLVASLSEAEHVLHSCVATVLRYSSHFKAVSDGFLERVSALTAHSMCVENEATETRKRSERIYAQLQATMALLARLEVKYSQLSRRVGGEERVLAQRYLQKYGITFAPVGETDDEVAERVMHAAAILSNSSGEAATPWSANRVQRRSVFVAGSASLLPNGGHATPSMSREPSSSPRLAPTSSKRQPTSNNGSGAASGDETEDLSLLSPRALHRKLVMHNNNGIGQQLSSARSSGRNSFTIPNEQPSSARGASEKLSDAQSAARHRHLSHHGNTVQHHSSSGSNVPRVAHLPSTANSSFTFGASAMAAGFNLAQASPEELAEATRNGALLTSPTPRRLRARHGQGQGRTRARGAKASNATSSLSKKKQRELDLFEESSSEDEGYIVRPVSYTPPPSNTAIRALDFEQNDQNGRLNRATDGGDISSEGRTANENNTSSTIASSSSSSSSSSSPSPSSSKANVENQQTAVVSDKHGAQATQTQNEKRTPRARKQALSTKKDKQRTGKSKAAGEQKSDMQNGHATYRDGDETMQRDGSPSASSRKRRNGSDDDDTTDTSRKDTVAWVQRLREVMRQRQQQRDLALAMAKASTQQDVAISSFKARMQQPSPYQQPLLPRAIKPMLDTHSTTATRACSSIDGTPLSSHVHSAPRPPATAAVSTTSASARSQRRRTAAATLSSTSSAAEPSDSVSASTTTSHLSARSASADRHGPRSVSTADTSPRTSRRHQHQHQHQHHSRPHSHKKLKPVPSIEPRDGVLHVLSGGAHAMENDVDQPLPSPTLTDDAEVDLSTTATKNGTGTIHPHHSARERRAPHSNSKKKKKQSRTSTPGVPASSRKGTAAKKQQQQQQQQPESMMSRTHLSPAPRGKAKDKEQTKSKTTLLSPRKAPSSTPATNDTTTIDDYADDEFDD